MSTSQGIWSPSQDKAAADNAVAIADIAYTSVFSAAEERLQGLPDSADKQAIRNSAFQLQQTIDAFIEGQTAGLVEQLEAQRGKAVLAIRKLQVEVTALNSRSKHLEATMTQADSENINLQAYNVRKAKNSKPSDRMGLPHEVEEWRNLVNAEEAKMQRLHDVLNAHKAEYAEVNRELTAKVQEFNLAQQRESELWNRIQLLKKSPEVLKQRIKSELLKCEQRRELLKSALVSLGSFNTSGVGLAG